MGLDCFAVRFFFPQGIVRRFCWAVIGRTRSSAEAFHRQDGNERGVCNPTVEKIGVPFQIKSDTFVVCNEERKG